MPLALTDLDFATDRLFVTAWHDAVIDKVGLDPRSSYVEQFWLSILGPSTTWLLRRMAAGLDVSPSGFSLPLEATARSLGLGGMPGRHGPFLRALGRCCQFGMARPTDQGIEVRRKVPPLTRRQVERLPEPLRADHQRWQEEQLRTPPDERQRRRACRLALSLLELGEDVEATERQLHRWRYHPALAREATAWAWKRHRGPTGELQPPVTASRAARSTTAPGTSPSSTEVTAGATAASDATGGAPAASHSPDTTDAATTNVAPTTEGRATTDRATVDPATAGGRAKTDRATAATTAAEGRAKTGARATTDPATAAATAEGADSAGTGASAGAVAADEAVVRTVTLRSGGPSRGDTPAAPPTSPSDGVPPSAA